MHRVADIATIIDIMAGKGGDDKAPKDVVAVDLGLPSGTKWANMNVGAVKPEDYGLFFAWGEATGYTSDTSDGHLFDWASYKWMNDGQSDWTQINKYQVKDGQTDGCWYDSNGNFIGDGKVTLDLSDDAASANWGGQWVMPTYEDMRELLDNTTSEWTTENGVNGRRFTSKTNGNSVFLPAAGVRDGSSLYYQSYGNYWSASVYPTYSYFARGLDFGSGYVHTYDTHLMKVFLHLTAAHRRDRYLKRLKDKKSGGLFGSPSFLLYLCSRKYQSSEDKHHNVD